MSALHTMSNPAHYSASLALYFMVLNWAEDTKSVTMSCVATVNFFVGGFYVMFFVNFQRYVVSQVVFCAAFKML